MAGRPARLSAYRAARRCGRNELRAAGRAAARRAAIGRDVGCRLVGHCPVRCTQQLELWRRNRARSRYWAAGQHAFPADGVRDRAFDEGWAAPSPAHWGIAGRRVVRHRSSRRRPIRYQRDRVGGSSAVSAVDRRHGCGSRWSQRHRRPSALGPGCLVSGFLPQPVAT
jgi:hypothetical protein